MIQSIRTPSYRRHKASGQAVVTLSGKMCYLGLWKSKASKIEYDRIIGEWLAGGRQLRQPGGADLTITELAARYWQHCEVYYGGGHTGEIRSIKAMLSHLRRLYGPTAVRDFGTLSLKSLRESMVSAGWARPYVNVQISRLRRMFAWGVENELVPGDIWHALKAVAGLRRGKTEASEPEPIEPVADGVVDAMLPFVSAPVKAMIELQLLTGCS